MSNEENNNKNHREILIVKRKFTNQNAFGNLFLMDTDLSYSNHICSY
jgi:hypothetical protein